MVNIPAGSPVFTYTLTLRSRYSETDKMGYVYYGHYLSYFEVARTEMLRSAGIAYSDMEKDGVMLPVIFAQTSYKSPIHYDEQMNIEVMIFDTPLVKLDTYYRVTTVSGSETKIHVTGQVILCFTNIKTRKPCRAPEYILTLFEGQ
jgi:acyl-CoA thioester hydrolase